MGKRQREGSYRSGDCSLGRRRIGGAIVYVADYRDAGARKRAKLGRFATYEAACAALDSFAEARRAVLKQQSDFTIGQLWAMWLADREKDGLANAIYKANWVSLAPFFAHRAPLLLVTDDTREYARHRFALGRAAGTVSTELARLRACLKWAFAENHIPRVPRVWIPSRGKPRNRVLSFAEATALANAAGDPHIHLFILVAFATGARHTAILDLEWSRVDFALGTIQFDTMAKVDPMSRRWRKGRATVPMGARLRAELLRAYEARQTAHVIEHGGRRLKTVKTGFAAAVKRAGLSPDITPHTIRHTVSTWLQEKGVGLEHRARLLGHGDIATTDTHYSHADASYLADTIAILDRALPQLPSRGTVAGRTNGRKPGASVPNGHLDGPA